MAADNMKTPTTEEYQRARDLFLSWYESSNTHGHPRNPETLRLAATAAYALRHKEQHPPRIYPGRAPLAIGDEITHHQLGMVRVIQLRAGNAVDVVQIKTGDLFTISGSTI